MPPGHLISRVTILGTGLIGGSFSLALRKYTTEMHISGWDPPEVVREAQSRGAIDQCFSADLFRGNTYALIGASSSQGDPRVSAFVKILEKIGARPLWLGAPQHDYAVGLASHLPQLAAVALAGFLYDRLDENGLPITLAGPGLRDSLRLAGSPYSTWRDIVLTNQEVLSAALDLLARRLDDLREKLASRELEADFDAANELYKLLRSL